MSATNHVASLSTLYQETADMDGSTELFAPIAALPIIQALAKKGVRTEPTLRFTQAACHGAIHPALKPFFYRELRDVQETLDYWQFPVSWSTAIAEELAFRRYQSTGELTEPIATPVQRIMSYIESITGAAGDIASVFSTSKSTALDTFLGRRKIGKQFVAYKDLSIATSNAVRFMLTDLMDLMNVGIRLKSYDVSVRAIRDGNIEGFRWLAEKNLILKLPRYTRFACEKQSLPMLKLLLELGIPLETEECWKAILSHENPDTSMLDFLYEIAPTNDIESHIHSVTAFNWAQTKGIPLEHRVVFTGTQSLPVIEALLDIGFIPTPADVLAASYRHDERLLLLILKWGFPITNNPERLVRESLRKGFIGGVVNAVRYEMVFDRAALWTDEHKDTKLTRTALRHMVTHMKESGYLSVNDTDTTKGFVIGGKAYPCFWVSDVLTIADAIVADDQKTISLQ